MILLQSLVIAATILFFPGAIHPAQATDAGTAAVTVVGGLGAITAIDAAAYSGLLASEVSDWKNPDTDVTGALDHQCDADIEIHLLGASRVNFLFFGIKSGSTSSRFLKPDDIQMTFGSGRTRYAAFTAHPGNIELKPGWRVVGIAPFPSKADFKDQDSLDIKIPLVDPTGNPVCTIDTSLHRSPEIPRSPDTYTERTALEYAFDLGAALNRVGSLANVGSPGTTFDVTMYGYGSLHHGFYLNVMYEGYNSGSAATLLAATGGVSNPQLSGLEIGMGYSHRGFFPGGRWGYTADLGPGIYLFSYATSAGSNAAQAQFDLSAKLTLDYRLARVLWGFWGGDYSLGLSIYDNVLPGASIGPVPASGNSIGITGQFKIGF